MCVCVVQKCPSCAHSLAMHVMYETRAPTTCTLRRRRRRKGAYKRGYVAVIRNCVKSCTTTTNAGPNNEGCYAVCLLLCGGRPWRRQRLQHPEKQSVLSTSLKNVAAQRAHIYTHEAAPPEKRVDANASALQVEQFGERCVCLANDSSRRDKMII